jgi:predicted RNase H-like HicB family nuclease
MRILKFIVERHSDGFLAYLLGLRGVVMGPGESYKAALADAKSAAQFHIETSLHGTDRLTSEIRDAYKTTHLQAGYTAPSQKH